MSDTGHRDPDFEPLFGDIDLAEEGPQEAFVVALRRWPDAGTPPNPGGWLTTTARWPGDRPDPTRVHPRRQTRGHARRPPEPDPSSLHDDRLRLIFTCCHPALVTDAQVALTLRLLGGLTAGEIAQGFLVPEATMAKRLPGPSRRSRPIGSHTASRPMPSCPTGSPVYSPRSTWSSTRATFPQAGAAPSGSICAPRRSGSHGFWHR